MAAAFKWGKFSGLNNAVRPEELGPTDLSAARNADIDRENRASRRKGYASLITGNYHSLWAAPDESICLAVKGGVLYRVNLDWTERGLLSNVGDASMSYAYVNQAVYFTNGQVIGYVTGGAALEFADPAMHGKTKTFPGHLIAYFNGHLLIAKDNALFFTDALAFNRIDMRKGFKQVPSKIAAILPVDGGVYVSDQADTYFLAGVKPTAWTLRRVEGGIIPGSGVVIDAKLHKPDMQGKLALFTTAGGVCMGTSDGQVIGLTHTRYRMPVAAKGAVLVREEADKRQYVVSLYN